MTAVQARLHASMRKEFDILVNVIKDFGEPSYPYETDEEEDIKVTDFDKRIDVMPVSDPNAATMAQRIMQYQAAFQLSQSAPEMYDLKELHRQMLDVLGIQDVDDIVPDESDIPPVDPVSAVQNLINNKPVKAYEFQDHDAHIQTVASAQENPEIQKLVGQSPNAPSILASGSAYILEHLTMKYRDEVEKEMGIELPPLGEPLPADVEKRISELVAEASTRVSQAAMIKAEQERINQQMQDPLILAKQRELDIKQAEVQRKTMGDQARFTLAAQKQEDQLELEREKIESEQAIEGVKIGQRIASDLLEKEIDINKQSVDDFKSGIDMVKNIVDDVNKNE